MTAMSRYVLVRNLSSAGVTVSRQGWLLLFAACAVPVSQPWPTAALFVWMAIGAFVLRRSMSALEIQTGSGFRKWVGLIVAWPASARLGAKLLSDPGSWLAPPKTTVAK